VSRYNQGVSCELLSHVVHQRDISCSAVQEIVGKRIWWRDEIWVADGSWITTRQMSRHLASHYRSMGWRPGKPGWLATVDKRRCQTVSDSKMEWSAARQVGDVVERTKVLQREFMQNLQTNLVLDLLRHV